MATIRAMLFDFDGTLCTFETAAMASRQTAAWLAERAGIAADSERVAQCIRAAVGLAFKRYANQPFYRYDDLFAEAYREGLEQAGARVSVAEIDAALIEFERVASANGTLREGSVETLVELRRRGQRLGIISNSDERGFAQRIAAADLLSYVDFALSSETAGSCKPDGVIFRKAVELAGCRPDEALFVGDTPDQDIIGAGAAGLQTALLVPEEKLELPWLRGEARPDFTIRSIPEVLTLIG